MRWLLFFLFLFTSPSFGGGWEFKAFLGRKIQLPGGNLTGVFTSTSGAQSKTTAEFGLLVLVNNKCIHVRDTLKALGFQVKHKNSNGLKIEALNARYAGSLSLDELEARLATEPCIAGVTENPEVRSQAVSDPMFMIQPALGAVSQLRGEEYFFHPIWGIRKEVTVAVVDSGAQLNHPDLASRIWRGTDGNAGFDFVNDDSDPSDDFGHGTHVAGIILAQKDNGTGIRGVMGDYSRLMAVKSQDSSGSGTMADVVNAFRWAIDHGAEVVNLSLASRVQNQALVDALNYAIDRKVTVVVAAGNDGEQITSGNFITPVGYASSFAGVIGVGSIDANSKLRSTFSNYGPNFVEISAPGSPGANDGILSTYPGGKYGGLNGTSMAAPHVAGAAALVTGFLKTHAIESNPDQVEQLILTSADLNSANANYFTGGRALNLESLGRYLFNATVVTTTGGFDE